MNEKVSGLQMMSSAGGLRVNKRQPPGAWWGGPGSRGRTGVMDDVLSKSLRFLQVASSHLALIVHTAL